MLALFLTARVLELSMGLWRATGAVIFAVIIGVIVELIFRRDEAGGYPDRGGASEASDKPGTKVVGGPEEVIDAPFL